MRYLTKSALWLLLISSCAGTLEAQTVCDASDAQCRKMQAELCAMPERTNLEAKGVRSIAGSFKDVTGATFPAGYVAQLRNAETGTLLRSSTLDRSGRFMFTVVPARANRLILVRMVDGAATRFGFWQADSLRCIGVRLCDLVVILQAAPTDLPINLCPPK